MKKRHVHIDFIESIAILFVVIYHTILYSSEIIENNSCLTYLSYFFNTILSVCVPLFFFANGYLLFNREFCLKKHIFKILRLTIITYIWAFIYLIFLVPHYGGEYSLRSFVFNVLNMNGEYRLSGLWFMGAIVCIYILFPALKALFDTDKKSFIFFLIVCAIFTFGITLGQELSDILTFLLDHRVSIVNQKKKKMFNPFRGIFGYSIVYFCIGGLVFNYEDKILSIMRWKRNTISTVGVLLSCNLLFCLGLFYSNFNQVTWDVVWYGYDTIFTFANVILIYILSLNLHKKCTLTYTISCNTLGIYFIHSLFIPFTKPWLESVDVLCNIPCSVIYAIAILFASLIISIALKKIPLIKKLQLS